jgi:hypothetical protein
VVGDVVGDGELVGVGVGVPAIQFKIKVMVCFCAARPAGID